MIPLTSSYSYQNEYKGYLPSMEKIIVGIKDRNNEVHYIEKNVNYDSRKYIDKLEELMKNDEAYYYLLSCLYYNTIIILLQPLLQPK